MQVTKRRQVQLLISKPLKEGRMLKELDGIRAIAILQVAFFHIGLYFEGFFTAILSAGFLGVQVFFILSAFLLSRQFLLADRSAYEKRFIGNYLKNRLRRIFPLFFFSSIILLVFRFNSVNYNEANLLKYFLFLSDIHVNPVIWSLFVEIRFYLILPIVMFIIYHLNNKGDNVGFFFLALLLLAGYAYHIYHYSFIHHRAFSFYFFSNTDCFILGVIGAILYEKNKGKRLNRKLLKGVQLGSLTFILFLMQCRYYNYFGDTFTKLCLVHIYNILWATFILTILFLGDGILNKLLSARFMAWISTISYSIYLWHLPIKEFMADLTAHYFEPTTFNYYTLRFALSIGTTFVISALSYKFIEKPFLKRSYPKAVVAFSED